MKTKRIFSVLAFPSSPSLTGTWSPKTTTVYVQNICLSNNQSHIIVERQTVIIHSPPEYHIILTIYTHSSLYAALERYSRYFGEKNFLSSTRLAFVYLTCFNDGIMLFKDFVPFGNTVHFIAQDFYFLYQRHKKNQTVKILYNSIRINPSINTCIPIHVYKNSRYIYMYNNSETKAVISSKLNQFLQIKQRLHHHLKLHYKHEYVGVLI